MFCRTFWLLSAAVTLVMVLIAKLTTVKSPAAASSPMMADRKAIGGVIGVGVGVGVVWMTVQVDQRCPEDLGPSQF